MPPDAASTSSSPFSAIPEAAWVCENELAFAIFDSYPVSPGHVLVITRRVVATYFDCTAAEQAAVMELVGEVNALLDPKPDGYNVGFNAGVAQPEDARDVAIVGEFAGVSPRLARISRPTLLAALSVEREQRIQQRRRRPE
jgi:hypothetical protein